MNKTSTRERALLDQLVREVHDLRARVESLELRLRSGLETVSQAAQPLEQFAPLPELPLRFAAGIIPLLGQAMLALAGAYVLRALTEAEVIPKISGVMVALVYGAIWLLLASRVPTRASRLPVAVYALTAVSIVCPLLIETTLWLHILQPGAASITLVCYAGLGLALAWRRNLPEIAWITGTTASVTAIVLILGTRDMAPLIASLVVIGAMTEAGALYDRWLPMRWIIASGLDLSLLSLVYLFGRREGLPESFAPISKLAALALLAAPLGVYLVSTTMRTLRRGLAMTGFEVCQLAVTLLLFAAGGLRIVQGVQQGPAGIALFCLLAGAASYATAFGFIDRRSGRGRNFYCYTTFALLLLLSGTTILFPPFQASLVCSGLAVAATWLGVRSNRTTLRLHGAACLAMATMVSGLFAHAGRSLLGGLFAGASELTPDALAVAFALGLCYGLLPSFRKFEAKRWEEAVPATAMAAMACWSFAGLAAGLLIPRMDTAWAATIRTQVLSSSAVLMGWAARGRTRPDLSWLLYPWMAIAAVKLLLEDFRFGTSVTLVVSLLFFGGALILLPILARRRSNGDGI